MDGIKIKPAIKQQATFRRQCPKCGKFACFSLIRHGTDLALFDFRVKKLRDHTTAVCGECAAVFAVRDREKKHD